MFGLGLLDDPGSVEAPYVVYDTGALIAAERGRRAFLASHQQSLEAGLDPIVPDVVAAKVWRGSARQAMLSRVLVGCEVVTTSKRTARAAGVLCGRAGTGTSAVVDAIVVVTAIRLAAPVFTDDEADLTQLAEAMPAPLVVHAP